jgi:uncharacterized protein YkwD
MQRRTRTLALARGALVGCGASTLQDASVPSSGDAPSSELAAMRARGPLGQHEAERYVLALVNRDRKLHDLPPVTWDETAARAGRAHARDMAAHGYTAHLGTDGSVPEQRYTRAGGQGMSMENAGCLADGKARPLDPNPRYLPAELERIQKAFMDEVPPGDGHRRNILTVWHTSLGIGLAQTQGLDIPCMAQEFVDAYGTYDELPKTAKLGSRLRVAGKVHPPAKIAGIGVARIASPKPMTADALNRTSSYAIPKPYATYFPRGFKTPIPLDVDERGFRIEVPLSDRGQAGLYEISVWAELPHTKNLVMISLRTVEVR